jgi:hypothetical protein
MQDDIRRAVAYIAGCAISKEDTSSIFDFTAQKHFFLTGDVSKDVSVFDHTTSCHITGSIESFFHHGRRSHISLDIDRDSFAGFDFGSQHHFSGNVSGNSIQVFDHGASRWFHYSI